MDQELSTETIEPLGASDVKRQGCRGYGDSHGDSHGYGYGMGMGSVMNPHGPVGPVGLLWGFLIGWRLSGNALNVR